MLNVVSRHVIRTGSPDGDQHQLRQLQAHAASQGLATRVEVLPAGGLQVDLVAPAPGGYGAPPPGYGPPAGGYGAPPPGRGQLPPAGGLPGAAPSGHGMMAMARPSGFSSAMQQGSTCQACQRHAPTKHVTFRQNIGLVILRIPKTITGNMCRRCIGKYFWETTLISSFFGWWGVISFFYTLISIPTNIATFLGARSLPDQ